jgi:hypothetical protein
VARRVWTLDDVRAWFAERIPPTWFTAVRVAADREEIVVTGELAPPDEDDPGHHASGDNGARLACTASIQRFRDATREARIAIADEAELLWGRKVSWAVACGGYEESFTNIAAPVMTRLRMRERAVLDVLIDGGVARTRSEALAWCVRLVGEHEHDWLDDLRDAMARVEHVRREGPNPD